jgi:hypothetical protein
MYFRVPFEQAVESTIEPRPKNEGTEVPTLGMRRKEQLTIKQKKLVEALAVAKNQTEAGQMAGYATKLATSNALNRIRVNAPEVLEQLGFSLEVVIDKYLRPGLEAKQTKFFAHQGKVVGTRNVINWNARHRYLDMCFKITGAYQHAAKRSTGRLRSIYAQPGAY